MRKAITLTDIAREIGVSAMTVSAVLNGGNSNVRVSSETRARINEAARRLGYRPNVIGRGLSRRRMNLIGVVAEFNRAGRMNVILHELLDGILEGCVAFGQNATIYSITWWQFEENKILNYCNGLVDGLLFLGPDLTDEPAMKLVDAVPVVGIHNVGSLAGATNIDIDNVLGAQKAVQYLLALGHRRIAHVSGSKFRAGSTERLNGYREALSNSGIDLDTNLVINGDYTYDCGIKASAELVARFGVDRMPTAVFCANDASAHGVIDGLIARGISVPRNVSVVGFDDALGSPSSTVKLTTVRQPLHAMGVYAAASLVTEIDEYLGAKDVSRDRVSTPNFAEYQKEFERVTVIGKTIRFEPTLVIRDSASAV